MLLHLSKGYNNMYIAVLVWKIHDVSIDDITKYKFSYASFLERVCILLSFNYQQHVYIWCQHNNKNIRDNLIMSNAPWINQPINKLIVTYWLCRTFIIDTDSPMSLPCCLSFSNVSHSLETVLIALLYVSSSYHKRFWNGL